MHSGQDKRVGHSRADSRQRRVRREARSLTVLVGKGRNVIRRRSPSAEASNSHPAGRKSKRARTEAPKDDDLREYLYLKRKFEQEERDVMKA